jgi:AmmeMemoRadiSam system protein B
MGDFCCSCAVHEKVRSSIVGGLFYPDDEEETRSRLESFNLKRGKGGKARVILAPHGSWDISGSIAGSAFSAASGRGSGEISRVVILGPIHNIKEEGLFLTDSDSFFTPLGKIPVDRETRDEFASCSTRFEVNDIPHLIEHSIEVLLPFIDYCFPGAAIVPILLAGTRPNLISVLARSLRLVLEPVMHESLIVVSCNLAMDRDEAKALRQAEECIELLKAKDARTFGSGLVSGRISACGGGLIVSLLESGLEAELEAELISGPIVKSRDEKNRAVCYGAFSYT